VKKVNYFKHMNELLDEFDKIIIVGIDNVQSNQFHQVRNSLRGKAVVLLGKNTMMLRVLSQRVESSGSPRDKMLLAKLAGSGKRQGDRLLEGNVGLVFTNGDLKEMKDIMDKNKVQAPARAGAWSPVEVVVPAGNTGLEPSKTSFFQALNIGTKITKGTVEILKDEKVLKVGDKVGNSEAQLLQMLNINPFFYGLIIKSVYDNGSVYGPQVLEMTDADMQNKFSMGVSQVAAFSLGSGYTTKASFPYVLMDAFKNLLAVSVSTQFYFDKYGEKTLCKNIVEGKVTAAPAAVAPAAGKKEAKKEEKKVVEEEEEEEMGFGLFD